MYHRIVRRKIEQGYAQISGRNVEPLLAQFAPDIHFTFAGQHALGADLHSRDGVRQWFQRVAQVFPGLQIRAERIFVSGPPWNTVVTTQFAICDTLPDGSRYENRGVQIARLVWGRVVEDYLTEDTQTLVQTLQRLTQLGNRAADAGPLRG
jgi:ketosteroid isomerase-like protein